MQPTHIQYTEDPCDDDQTNIHELASFANELIPCLRPLDVDQLVGELRHDVREALAEALRKSPC